MDPVCLSRNRCPSPDDAECQQVARYASPFSVITKIEAVELDNSPEQVLSQGPIRRSRKDPLGDVSVSKSRT